MQYVLYTRLSRKPIQLVWAHKYFYLENIWGHHKRNICCVIQFAVAKLVESNQGLYKQSLAVGEDTLPTLSSQFQYEYNLCCKNNKNAMWLGQAVGTKAQTNARFTEDSYWESSMLLACMKLNYGEQMNSWGQRFAHWGHVQWKSVTEFGRFCNVLNFIYFLCLHKRDQAPFGSKGPGFSPW